MGKIDNTTDQDHVIPGFNPLVNDTVEPCHRIAEQGRTAFARCPPHLREFFGMLGGKQI